jgi:hypothetical protein
MTNEDLLQQLSSNGLKWMFNVERAPWWGGVFERMIGSTKRCLKKMIGKSKLSYDELFTILIEIEAVVNSRPISFVSSDDLSEPLTPAHLLIGRHLLTLPDNLYSRDHEDYNLEVTPDTLSKRMEYLNRVLSEFWRRWKNEYLIGLREYHCHKKQVGTISITFGDVVLVQNQNRPRGFWDMGRVEETLPGRDRS